MVVRRPPDRLRRRSRSRGSTRSRPATSSSSTRAAADYWRALYLATLALLVVFRVLVPLASAFRYRLRVAEVDRGGAGRRLAADHRPHGSTGCARAPGQFFLWRFLDRRRVVDRAPVLALGGARRHGRCGSRSRRSATTPRRLRRASGPARAWSPRGRSASSPSGRRRREKVLLIAGGIGITPDPRADRADARRRRRPLPRRQRGRRRLPRRARRARRAQRGIDVHYVVGDHATATERDLLSPAHLRELVPDIAEREVYVCGPPAMTDVIAQERPRGRRPAPPRPRRALRALTERRPPCARATHNAAQRRRRSRCPRRRLGAAAAPSRRPPKKKVVVGDEDVHRRRRPAPTAGATSRSRSSSRRRRPPPAKKKTVTRQITAIERAGLPGPHRPLQSHQPAGAADPRQETLQAQSADDRHGLGRDLHERGVRAVAPGRDPEGEEGCGRRRRCRASAASSRSWACRSSSTSATTTPTRLRSTSCSTGSAGSTRRFSTYKDDSEISRLNRGELALADAHPDVRWVLARCEELRAETDGYFDVRAASGRRSTRPGLVKGWSVDRARRDPRRARAAQLRDQRRRRHPPSRAGAARAGAGGSASSTRSIARQGRGGRRGDDLAIATSGAYARGDHVLDPHTRRAAEGVLSVTITGPDLATADAYATAAFAMGPRGPALDGAPARLRGDDDPGGRAVAATPGFPLAADEVSPSGVA